MKPNKAFHRTAHKAPPVNADVGHKCIMNNTLFLYLDILGFTELIKTPDRVDHIFKVLDSAALHRDSNYRAIAFSDTLLAYQLHDDLKGYTKANELMFLIELVQDIFLKLIGSGVFFRAIITEGSFNYSQLQNMQAYYGQALVEACHREKDIKGIGLYLDKRLEKYNQVFRYYPFSPDFHFIYLTHTLTRITPKKSELFEGAEIFADPEFPIPEEMLTLQDLQFGVYPEIIHLKEVFELKNSHPLSDVNAKHLAAWTMYELAYPKLVKSLEASNFSLNGVADMDWAPAKAHYEQSRD